MGIRWSSEGETSLSRAELAFVAAITLVGLGLRLRSISNSLFGDEVGAFAIVNGHGLGGVLHTLYGHSVDLNPPLFFILSWAALKLFGVSAVSVRLISCLAGTATIPLTYLLGRITVGIRAGAVAAVLAALSPFLIFYSTEARPYALLAALVLLSTLALVRALRSGRVAWWAMYALCTCAAMYTHYTGVFVLIAQFLWALWSHRSARRALVAATVASVVGFLPWLPALIKNIHSPGTKVLGALEPFSVTGARIDLEHWSVGHPFLALRAIPGLIAIALLIAGVLAATGGLVAGLARAGGLRGLLRPSRETVLVVSLMLATPVGLALYSSLRPTVWDRRDLIASWPAFALTLGALLGAVARVRVAAVALVVAAFVVGSVKTLATDSQRPDYAGAVRYVEHAGAPGDPIVGLGNLGPGPPTNLEAALELRDHAVGHDPALRLGIPPLGAVLRAPPYALLPIPSGDEVAKQGVALASHARLFLVMLGSAPIRELRPSRPTGPTPLPSVATPLQELTQFLSALPARFQLRTTRTFPGIFGVTVYEFAAGQSSSAIRGASLRKNHTATAQMAR